MTLNAEHVHDMPAWCGEWARNLKGIDVVAVMERLKALRGCGAQKVYVDNVLRQRVHLERH